MIPYNLPRYKNCSSNKELWAEQKHILLQYRPLEETETSRDIRRLIAIGVQVQDFLSQLPVF